MSGLEIFGELTVLYLFLGGTGAGTIVCALVIDVFHERSLDRCPTDAVRSGRTSHTIWVNYSLIAGLMVLIIGVLALALDIGREDRILLIFLAPTPSMITLGTYAITALIGVCVAYLVYVFRTLRRRTLLAKILQLLLLALSVLVMGYTGVLLMSAVGVAFWNTPIIPIIFTLSSLACGIGVVLVLGFFVPSTLAQLEISNKLIAIDSVLIILKFAFVAFFIYRGLVSNHPGIVESINTLLRGSYASIWWFGFIFLGMIVPLIIEIAIRRGVKLAPIAFGVIALLILAGGFCLRWSIVVSGEQRGIELGSSEVVSSSLGLSGSDGTPFFE